jgi:uncharacterized protein with von Willebrand factor type A (vWA) domain
MKGALIEEYSNPTYKAMAHAIAENFLLENKRLPLAVVQDAGIVHYKPWSAIIFNPHVKGGWRAILERYWSSEPYRLLNNAVAGDALLSKYAAIQFLNNLFKTCEKKAREMKKDGATDNPIQLVMDEIGRQNAQGNPSADRLAAAIASALEQEAKEILQDIQAAESFSHVGLPVARFLEKPDEFRDRMRNRIIVHLVKFLRRLRREAPSLKMTRAPTLIGGRPLGVKTLQRWSELPRSLPVEHLDDDLFSYRVASRTLRVSEQYGSITNYIVYLDKSGSMGGDIAYRSSPTQVEYVPKISFAAAGVLALASRLRQVGARMTLKLFDVEVHDAISNPVQLIDVLMRVRADSGTNLTRVLEDATKHRDDRIIIITDGIDEVEPESVRRAKALGLDVSVVFIKTDNALLRQNFPCIYLQEAKPEVILSL